MTQQQRELADRRGLRFAFDGMAEVMVEGAARTMRARVTELSFRGCYLEVPSGLNEKQRVQVKIVHSGETFEAPGEVIYARPSGVGLMFGTVEPRFRNVLQDWILTELDNHRDQEL
jgi:hypothetical protein